MGKHLYGHQIYGSLRGASAEDLAEIEAEHDDLFNGPMKQARMAPAQAALREQVTALLDSRSYPAAKRPQVLAQAERKLQEAGLTWPSVIQEIVADLGAALARAGYR